MTQLDKMLELKDTISILYEKEGRPISYIANLLQLDRSRLSKQLKEWDMKQSKKRHINSSTQKFINKNRNFIISKLKDNTPISTIKEKQDYENRQVNKKKVERQEKNFFEELDGEEWKEILGFTGYYVSNKGRFKKYLKTYDCFKLLTCTPNSRNGRLYITLYTDDGIRKNLMAARVVAHAFCEGYSEVNNTVDHKDKDVSNNEAINLEWAPQSENNKRANISCRNKAVYGGKHGRFKEIVLDDEFHFKTIRALAKFLNVSETQAHRYIDKETKIDRKIELIY